jgi:hypothetical protein
LAKNEEKGEGFLPRVNSGPKEELMGQPADERGNRADRVLRITEVGQWPGPGVSSPKLYLKSSQV